MKKINKAVDEMDDLILHTIINKGMVQQEKEVSSPMTYELKLYIQTYNLPIKKQK